VLGALRALTALGGRKLLCAKTLRRPDAHTVSACESMHARARARVGVIDQDLRTTVLVHITGNVSK
jgi:hypothetical protein